MQPSEIDRMGFWEWELTVEKCQEIIEEEKKQQEEQEKGYKGNNYQRQAQRMMSGYGTGYNGLPKMPGSPSIPSIPKMPKNINGF